MTTETERTACKRCGSNNLNCNLREFTGPLAQCRDCGLLQEKRIAEVSEYDNGN